jgi:hypothetical protein
MTTFSWSRWAAGVLAISCMARVSMWRVDRNA